MPFRFLILCCLWVFAIACGGKGEQAATKAEPVKPEAAPSEAAKPSPPKSSAVFQGVIEGVVRLAEGATLPRIANIKDGSPFAMVEPPAPCSPLAEQDLTPVAMSDKRELRDIHVALTGMKDYPDPEPKNHDLYLSDCRLTPRLVGAAKGDSLRITNRSAVPLLPVFTGESFMQAVMPETSRYIKVEKLGASRVACTFGSYCGRTEVLVTAHPLFGVSDAKGHFSIANIPLDQEVTVHAWHPFFKDSTVTVRLSAAEPKRVIELQLTPAPNPQAAEASGAKPAAPKKPERSKKKDGAGAPSKPEAATVL